MLKTDVITVRVYASNNDALAYGQLSAAGQINYVTGKTYEIQSGNLDVPLPVINHLPGFTSTQELLGGYLAHTDGTT